MIVQPTATSPEVDEYDTALQELDRQKRNMDRAETVLAECRMRYELAWYAVLRLEELNARGGN